MLHSSNNQYWCEPTLTTERVNKFTQKTQANVDVSMKLEVLDLVKKLLKTMPFEMLRLDVGELVLRGDIMDVDRAFTDKLTNVECP